MEHMAANMPVKIKRFSLHQRFQHILMALSVLMLIVTGFPIKYAAEKWALYVINLFGSFDKMFHVHLAFAVLMFLSAFYHIVWLGGLFITKGPKWTIMPRLQDVKDAFQHAKYLAGISKKPPQFEKYTYLEKFEYFAVIWGVIVMGISGLVLWFPQLFSILPRWAMDVARVIHSNEAFVAMLAIVVGHFFAAHFNPKVFPSSSVWYNGSISIEHLKDEHPGEYQKLADELGFSAVSEELKPHGMAKNRFLIAVELIIYTLILVVLLGTFVPLLFA